MFHQKIVVLWLIASVVIATALTTAHAQSLDAPADSTPKKSVLTKKPILKTFVEAAYPQMLRRKALASCGS